MSNFLAIATATATLKHILLSAIQGDVPGSNVTTQTPDSVADGTPDPRVNIFLYQVTPNAGYRNMDLPTRRSSGQLVQRPRIALDLHYLITFYGNETTLEPQRLLGSVVRTIHEHSMLSRQDINKVIVNPQYPFLANSNLSDDVELVKFTPTTITLEELSKLWSVFFQIPYTLSVTFQGTVVLIESEKNTSPALPVRERNIVVLPFENPHIERIISWEGENAPIHAESTILIQGKKLQGKDTRVRIAGELVNPQSVSKTEIGLSLDMPEIADNLRPGLQAVQVVHAIFGGPPPYGFESNVAAFVLRPLFDSGDVQYDADANTASVTVQPKVGQRQRALLILSKVRQNPDDPPETFTFTPPPRSEDTNAIVFPIEVEKEGEYLVRLQIDGAESPLETDDNGNYIGPKVLIGTAPRFELTTGVDPADGGSITLDPDKSHFDPGETVTLTAEPQAGFEFERWEGDIDDANSGDNPITLTMDLDRNITAVFEAVALPQRQLTTTVNPPEGGTIQRNPDKSTFNDGETARLTAISASGFRFLQWSGDTGDADTASEAIDVVMDRDRNITANFEVISVGANIVHEESHTGGSSESTTVSTTESVGAVAGHFYLAVISTKPNVEVDSVSGLGLTWTQVVRQCAGRNQTKVEIWRGEGTPDGDGAVTAQLSAEPKNAVIAVSRYSGVDLSNPLGNAVSANTNGLNGPCSGGSDSETYSQELAVTTANAVVYSAVAVRQRDHQSDAGFSERAEIIHGDDGGDKAGMIVQDKAITSPGSVVIAGNFFNNAIDWAMAGLELRPGTGTDAPSLGGDATTRAASTSPTPLRSGKINLSAQQIEGKIQVRAQVRVIDEGGSPVSNAAVAVNWTLPDGSAVEQTAASDRQGLANFSIENGDGMYALRVITIDKSGFEFDAQSGEVQKSLRI